MKEVLRELRVWRANGERIALATVTEVRRSAPRLPGAKLAVNERGDIAGSVSGGCVEGAVIEAAEDVLSGEPPRLLSFGIADDEAWGIGLPCGGEIDVWVQEYDPDPELPSLEQAACDDARLAEVTLLFGPGAGAKMFVDADGVRAGSLGDAELDRIGGCAADELIWREVSERHGELFVDVTAPPPRLFLFGAVDVASALCRLARTLGWRPYVIDPRARFSTQERFPDAEAVITAWPDEAFEQLGGIDPAASVAVLTHDPKLDDAALMLALRSPARFVGAMGSRRAQRARRERLLGFGLTEDELQRLSAPLGLDLGATGREETALSMMAEIVAARHGRDGNRLSGGNGRIHGQSVGDGRQQGRSPTGEPLIRESSSASPSTV